MKKTILYLLIFLAAGMTACFEDDSTLGSDFIPDITIAELRDTAIVSYAGNVLEITPQVTSEYDESELSYAWYIYNESNGTTTDGSELDGFRTEKIGDAKTLSYEVNIPSGLYGIVFEVTEARNGYARRAFMSLSVSTAFSQGLYILKETADGRSDLDLAFNGNFSEDILTNRIGAPLDGAPVNLSILYGQGYIDGETQEMAYTKGLNVFTEEDYRAFRTEDFYQIQDLSTVFYSGEPQEGEVLYGAYQGMMYNFYFSNKGYYGVNACGGMFGYENSGKIGFPIGAGGSKYAQNLMGGFGGTAYWNEIDRTVCWADYNASVSTVVDYDLPASMDAATVDCIGSGINYVGFTETEWFLLRDADNNRCVVLLPGSDMGASVVEIDPAVTPRFAEADIVAGNALSVSIIYFVSGNQLWAYSWGSNSEYNIPLPGVEGTINYVTNQFLNLDYFTGGEDENFDNLIVGTETAEGYNLYIFDDVVGGAPQSAVEPYQGTGTVKHVRYVPALQPDLSSAFGGVYIPWTD